jgi:hypothetical protein
MQHNASTLENVQRLAFPAGLIVISVRVAQLD